jgi:hypothetical protein
MIGNKILDFVVGFRDIQLQSLSFFKAVKIPKNRKYAWKFKIFGQHVF